MHIGRGGWDARSRAAPRPPAPLLHTVPGALRTHAAEVPGHSGRALRAKPSAQQGWAMSPHTESPQSPGRGN